MKIKRVLNDMFLSMLTLISPKLKILFLIQSSKKIIAFFRELILIFLLIFFIYIF